MKQLFGLVDIPSLPIVNGIVYILHWHVLIVRVTTVNATVINVILLISFSLLLSIASTKHLHVLLSIIPFL